MKISYGLVLFEGAKCPRCGNFKKTKGFALVLKIDEKDYLLKSWKLVRCSCGFIYNKLRLFRKERNAHTAGEAIKKNLAQGIKNIKDYPLDLIKAAFKKKTIH